MSSKKLHGFLFNVIRRPLYLSKEYIPRYFCEIPRLWNYQNIMQWDVTENSQWPLENFIEYLVMLSQWQSHTELQVPTLWIPSNLPCILAFSLLRFKLVPQKLFVIFILFYFFSIDWEHLKTQMPGVFSNVSKCLAETNSIVNGIQFHTWFVQAHLISSLIFNVNIWMKFLFVLIYSFVTWTMVSELTFWTIWFQNL